MTTYIQDLIELPEKVHGGDFVLKLTEGVEHPDETLKPYVVTPQLAECFDAALEFIQHAVDSNSSKATYLHGSFGSGKSHFMAVLQLLLQQHPGARAKEGLEGVVTRHDAWLEGKKFLMVPYHMIGQPSMEAAVLGGYVRRVLALHPGAPIPGVYRAEGLFHDARELRKTMGDASFFDRLNSRPAGPDGWGALEASWDVGRFEAALEAPPGSDDRSLLISALVEHFFQAYKDVARGDVEAYVSLDDGLAIISQHARALGYDALVLFLDEIMLWFATHAADQRFLNTEGPKVSKLVEAERADRPIPIVSFVARQRDLRELVGENVTGAEQLGFADVLRWWEARFDTITLEDRNLPEIAARRVLQPKSEAARQQIEDAWRQTEKIREAVLGVLLTPKADRSVFRKVYPFSPALMETLVAVSSVLQRERTALKVMLLLLVSQRATLELGQIVPVGDLFDVIAEGDEPFTEGMRLHFENAKRLYYQKLLPMLEKEHGASEEEIAALPYTDKKARAFLADDRLLKTLLLAALVPEVEVLKDLTASRLAALNHGTFRAPIPGRETQMVLTRCRNWTAAGVGELKIGDDPTNPTIAVQLTGVDTETILANAQAVDNAGNRRRKIRELLFEQLGVADRDEMFIAHEVTWRGTSRSFQVIFGNVRELTTESLMAKGGQRKAILDFPFDEAGRTPADDLARLDSFRSSEKPSRTLVWLPAFLSLEAQKDLGTLVKLDDILKNDDTFRRYASHLSNVDQVQARQLLRNQRDQLRQRVIRYLEGAYGVDDPIAGSVDESHRPASHFQSLDPSFTPETPVGVNLRQTFEHLLAQVLASQYPSHPSFGVEVRKAALRKVHAEVSRAAQAPDGRISVEKQKPLRSLMHEVAVPLKLGEMGETHFVLGRHWYNHLNKQVGGPEGSGEVTVGRLRAAFDEPSPMGLSTLVGNLVILLYADQTNRSFVLHGGPAHPKLDDLRDELELRERTLPPAASWEEAIERSGKVFGLSVSPLRNASNVSELADDLAAKARDGLEDCQAVKDRLEGLYADYGIDREGSARWATASAVLALVRGLVSAGDEARVEALASAAVATSSEAMAKSYTSARAVREVLSRTRWEAFEGAAALTDDRAAAAQGIRAQLVEALTSNEYVTALGPRLEKLEGDAIRLLAPPKAPPKTATPTTPRAEVIDQKVHERLSADEAGKALAELGEKVAEDPALRLDVSWKLYREKGGE